jgi:hypothetical protein
MALDRGDPATAAAVLEGTLRRIPLGNRIARAEPLARLVEARLALGHETGAAAIAGQLADLATLSALA